MEKFSDAPQQQHTTSNDIVFLKGELTSPVGDDPSDDPFGVDKIVGDYYVKIRNGEQIQSICKPESSPRGNSS